MTPAEEATFAAERLDDCDQLLERAARVAWEARSAGGEFGARYVSPALSAI